MFFGLINVLIMKQKFLNNMFQDVFNDYVVFYSDNIFVYFSGTFKDHKQKVEEVLNCFDKYEFYFKPEKCTFHKTEVEYLGHLVGRESIKIDPKKTSSILGWPTPNSVKDIRNANKFQIQHHRAVKH